MAVSFQCMTKSTTNKKNNKKNYWIKYYKISFNMFYLVLFFLLLYPSVNKFYISGRHKSDYFSEFL